MRVIAVSEAHCQCHQFSIWNKRYYHCLVVLEKLLLQCSCKNLPNNTKPRIIALFNNYQEAAIRWRWEGGRGPLLYTAARPNNPNPPSQSSQLTSVWSSLTRFHSIGNKCTVSVAFSGSLAVARRQLPVGAESLKFIFAISVSIQLTVEWGPVPCSTPSNSAP